jgi:hypothetical protein
MSHTVQIKTHFKDLDVLQGICDAANVMLKRQNEHVYLYSGTYPAVASFELENWRYPVAIQEDGSIVFDNFNGYWGNIEPLHKIMQRYSVEKTKKEARLAGYSVQEVELEDGSIDLLIDN